MKEFVFMVGRWVVVLVVLVLVTFFVGALAGAFIKGCSVALRVL